MKDSKRLSIIIAFFIITTLISAPQPGPFGIGTGTCFAQDSNTPSSGNDSNPPYDYPENAIPLMKYWASKSDIAIAKTELNRVLKDLTRERAQILYSYFSKKFPEDFPLTASNLEVLRLQLYREMACKALELMEDMYKIYDYIMNEEFGIALAEIDRVIALFSEKTLYFRLEIPINRKGEIIKINPLSNVSLTYYDEQMLSHSTKLFYVDISSMSEKVDQFIKGFTFYSVLLKGEILYRSGAFSESTALYNEELEKGLEQVFLDLLNIKRSFNYLAWGDQEFKRAYSLMGKEKNNALESAQKKYESALSPYEGTVIYKSINTLENQLDKSEKMLIRDIKKPGAAVKVPFNLQEGLPLPTKPSIFTKPFKIKRKVEVTVNPIVETSFVTKENPLVIQIVCHAKMQLLKISKGLNYLGYTDGHVPDQRYVTLYAHATQLADMSIQAENRYIQFKREAEDMEYQTRQLQQNLELADYQIQIAKKRQDIAKERIKQAEFRMEAIDKELDTLEDPKLVWLGRARKFCELGTHVAAAVSQGQNKQWAGMASSINSARSTGIGFVEHYFITENQIDALKKQREALNIDKSIAAKESHIAVLEETIGKMQKQFMIENINFLALREMDQALFYALAKTLRQIKKKYLESGILMGFLAERALAFELGESDFKFIKLYYENSALKGLLAGDFLKQDLIMMEHHRTLSLKQRNHVKHIISLRDRYPLDFLNFIQTGTMDFSTGLYEFDKTYPGMYQRRLKRVEVAIQGSVGPEGIKGALTNFGSFFVRQNDTEIKRLLPTAEEVQNAYTQLNSGGLSIMPVGGVNMFILPPVRMVLSNYDIRQDQLIFPPESEIREPFEGFGVAGLWRLELPKNINDIDFRTIFDVKLILYFDAFYDPLLERKIGGYYDENGRWINGLVQEYKQELTGTGAFDRFASFSLRQNFPDEFFNLSDGTVEFELLDADFPPYMSGKVVKKIMVLAVDQEGKGVPHIELSICRKLSPPFGYLSFLFAKTDKNGFALDPGGYMNPDKEDLLPINKRFPIVGCWRIDLKNIAYAEKLNDLLVFFIYDYTETR